MINARMLTRSLLIAAAIMLALGVATVAWACPTCREGLADNPQGQSLATGFYYSILFMMSMPFIVLGTLVSFAYRSVQRAKSDQAESTTVESEG